MARQVRAEAAASIGQDDDYSEYVGSRQIPPAAPRKRGRRIGLSEAKGEYHETFDRVCNTGGLSLTAGAQVAPDNAVRIQGYQIELPNKIHKMYRGDFDTYKGAYNLSNDQVLRMSQQGKRDTRKWATGSQRNWSRWRRMSSSRWTGH